MDVDGKRRRGLESAKVGAVLLLFRREVVKKGRSGEKREKKEKKTEDHGIVHRGGPEKMPESEKNLT